ncbi:MAG: hypothetical protein GYB65_15800, partial [Chloroflexi bacterium]|nr:hypothetical protein [Chloroflexota bacterium]
PLILPDYTSEQQIEETIADLATNKPTLIVDNTMVDGTRIPPLDPARRQEWWAMGGRRDVFDLDPIYDFVADHCAIVEEIGDTAIYACTYDE